MLHELKAGGSADYFAFPMQLGRDGLGTGGAFSTDRPGGFSDDDVADLKRLVDMMGAVAEMHI